MTVTPTVVLQFDAGPSGAAPFGFVLGLLIGGLALFVASRSLTGISDYDHAVLTAVLGTLAWAVLSSIPLVGPAVALLAWIGVLKWRYPVGWLRAGGVGVAAWAVAVVLIAAIELLGVDAVSAVGVPGA